MDPRFEKKTIKFGGGNITVRGCFSYNGVGPIHRIDGVMTKEGYRDILDNVMLLYAGEEMPVKWFFQQDNDPKHS